jgi:hypothetical protein
MAGSDVLCILGYLLITFSQVFLLSYAFLFSTNSVGTSYSLFLFYSLFRIIGALTLEGCRSDVELAFFHMW